MRRLRGVVKRLKVEWSGDGSGCWLACTRVLFFCGAVRSFVRSSLVAVLLLCSAVWLCGCVAVCCIQANLQQPWQPVCCELNGRL